MTLGLGLGLGGDEGMLLTSGEANGVTCEAAPAPVDDAVVGLDEAASAQPVALLSAPRAAVISR